jgi:hypothetical protein
MTSVSVKFPLCLRTAPWSIGTVEAKLYAFLTPTLDGRRWVVSLMLRPLLPQRSPQYTPWIGGEMGPRATPVVVVVLLGTEPRPSNPNPVAFLTELSRLICQHSSVSYRVSSINIQAWAIASLLSTFNRELSRLSYQHSIVSYRVSYINIQPWAIASLISTFKRELSRLFYQHSSVSYRVSSINIQSWGIASLLSTFNRELSRLLYQHSSVPVVRDGREHCFKLVLLIREPWQLSRWTATD